MVRPEYSKYSTVFWLSFACSTQAGAHAAPTVSQALHH